MSMKGGWGSFWLLWSQDYKVRWYLQVWRYVFITPRAQNKQTKTRHQKRDGQRRRQLRQRPRTWTGQTEQGKEQREDQTLMRAWSAAEKGEEVYLTEDSLLYHRSKKDTGEEFFQLVLPTPKRRQVIEIAYSILLAEYFGQKKTIIFLRHFFRPGFHKDVAEACTFDSEI